VGAHGSGVGNIEYLIYVNCVYLAIEGLLVSGDSGIRGLVILIDYILVPGSMKA